MAQRPAAIAAWHEELHGIMRRSTLYGQLLNSLAPPDCATLAAEDALAHMLFSHGRTSEEIHATFGSLILAEWAGDTAACERELAGAPEYGYYFNVGAALTTAFEDPPIRALVLEGAIRFCWSSCHVDSVLGDPLNREALAGLPTCAYPDKRLAELKRDWPKILTDGLTETLLARFEFAFFHRKSFAELYDPLHGVLPEGSRAAVMDPEGTIQREAMARATTAATVSEALTAVVADYLAKHYSGTDWAAATVADSFERINALRGQSAKRPAAFNLIERVDNLANPRMVCIKPVLEWDHTEERPIVGIRQQASFERNFRLADDAQRDRNQPFVIYASAYNLGSNAHQDLAELGPIDLAICPSSTDSPAQRLQDWLPSPGIVALWSSLLCRDSDAWYEQIGMLPSDEKLPWVVVDNDPYDALVALSPLFEVVQGSIYVPIASRPGLGGLAISTIPDCGIASSGLRGFVLMGMVHTLKMISATFASRLGSNFRGGHGLFIHDDSRRKRNEGRALINWLAQLEYNFDFEG